MMRKDNNTSPNNPLLRIQSSLSRWALRAFGWKVSDEGDNLPKCVICVAPHTSNLDLFLGKLFYHAIGRDANFLIKKEWFIFPLSLLFRCMGGIPVNRGRSSSTTEQMAVEFNRREVFHLAVTPEGTRQKTGEWKKGFYYIALKANVPIQVAYLDYGRKTAGIKATFHPTGNVEQDMESIRSMYSGIKGRHEQNFIELK